MSHQLPNLVTSQEARAVREGRARSAWSRASWKGVGLSTFTQGQGRPQGPHLDLSLRDQSPYGLQPPWEPSNQDPQVSPDGQATAEGKDLPDKESPSPRVQPGSCGPGRETPDLKVSHCPADSAPEPGEVRLGRSAATGVAPSGCAGWPGCARLFLPVRISFHTGPRGSLPNLMDREAEARGAHS